MSFKQSVIIPYQTYKRCRFPHNARDVEILTKTNLSKDTKMKLFNQEQLRKKKKTPHKSITGNLSPDLVQPTLNKDEILQNIGIKHKPFASLILDIIKDNPTELSWKKETFEVILDGILLQGTNIIHILQYLMKNVTVTSESDIPKSVVDVYKKLLSFGIPTSWIKQKPPTRKSSRRLALSSKPISDEDKDDEEESLTLFSDEPVARKKSKQRSQSETRGKPSEWQEFTPIQSHKQQEKPSQSWSHH